jgi:hypothetical protein
MIMAWLRRHWLPLLLIVVVFTTRWWRLPETIQFQGDQGRDAILVHRFLSEGDVMLLGPVTSTGNMYLGPLYYYFMAPWLLLSAYNPIGPVVGVAILSTLTVWAIYALGPELVGRRAATLAALLAAISTVASFHARFSWNPNPAPFVSFFLLWSLVRARTHSLWYLVISSICVATLIQLHYVTLLVAPVVGIAGLWLCWQTWRESSEKRNRPGWLLAAKVVVVCVLVQLVFLIPQAAFEVRHDFLNVKSFQKFFSAEEGTISQPTSAPKLRRAAQQLHGRTIFLTFELMVGKSRHLNEALIVASVLVWLAASYQRRHEVWTYTNALLLGFVLTSIVGLAFYESSVFDHYVLFILPFIWLIHGQTLAWLSDWGPSGKFVAIAFFAAYAWWNVPRWPIEPLGWTIADIERTSQTILDRVQPDEKYNVVLVSESNDHEAQNYRYFLSRSDRPPVRDLERYDIKSLFIIDEQKTGENVTQKDYHDIVVFPAKEPTEVYTVAGGPTITVLRRPQ